MLGIDINLAVGEECIKTVRLSYKGSGNLGKSAKGTYAYMGGTGKYSGITGGGEFTRLHLQPPSKGMWSATTSFKGNWKLP